MVLWHATTRQNLASILEHGLLVSRADRAAKIKGCWMATAGKRPWGVLHTISKHKAQLADVVVIEVRVPRSKLTRFRTGLYYSTIDIAPERLGTIIPGAEFGRSASE